MEYIYVRGGGRYTVRTSGFTVIELHPSGYHWTSGSSSGDLPTRTSIETPVVNLDAAQKTAQEAKDAAASLNTTVTGLKNFTDEAFADGIVDRAEAASIEKYTNTVNETKESVDTSYSTVYNNTLLTGTAKTNLAAAKTAFDTAVANLLTSIQSASADGVATPTEKSDVDSKYDIFNTAYGTFNTRLEEALSLIHI